jgi:hypothetical protein
MLPMDASASRKRGEGIDVPLLAGDRIIFPDLSPPIGIRMAVSTETARLRRVTEEFVAGVKSDLKSKQGLTPAERRHLRAEIEHCTQLLDELRSSLSG